MISLREIQRSIIEIPTETTIQVNPTNSRISSVGISILETLPASPDKCKFLAKKAEQTVPALEDKDRTTFDKIRNLIEIKKNNRQNPTEAIQLLTALIEDLQNRTSDFDTLSKLKMAWHMRASLYYDQFDYRAAKKEYKAIVQLFKGDHLALFMLARLYFDTNEFEMAERIFRKTEKVSRNSKEDYKRDINILCMAYLQACISLRMNLPLDPKPKKLCSIHYFLLAHSFYSQRRYVEAEEYLNKLLANPNSVEIPSVHYLKSCIELRKGNVQKALDCLPYVGASFRTMLFNEAIKFIKSKKYENALQILDFLFQQLPAPNILLQRASVHIALNNKKLANDDYQRLKS